MKNVYFLSDAHLGSRAIEHGRTQERRLVNFLDSIKHKASAVYLLGDMFDFWYEFKTVVPKGYTRFLGKLSELTDIGVEVHFFTGNHDIWCGDYLTRECGVIMHREPLTTENLPINVYYRPKNAEEWTSIISNQSITIQRNKKNLIKIINIDKHYDENTSISFEGDNTDLDPTEEEHQNIG